MTVLAGCSASSEHAESGTHVLDETVNPATDPTASTGPTTGSTTFVDADGRTWSVRNVTTFAPAPSSSTPSFHPTSHSSESEALNSIEAYPSSEMFLRPQPSAPRMVIGTDDRTWVTPTDLSSSLGKVEISLSDNPWPSGYGCSAHLIGRATAIRAAHCFWPQGANNWTTTRAWSVGVVRNNNGTTVLYGPWYGCYWVTIPTAWTTNFDVADDWAVIDFENTGCGIAWPGDVVGWTAFMVDADPTATIDAPSYLNAYDLDSPLPPQPPGVTYYPPSLLARSGGPWSTAILSGSGGTTLTTTLDTTGGASGGGLLQPVNPYSQAPVFVGTISAESPPNNANYARRLDNNIWAFTQANCAEW